MPGSLHYGDNLGVLREHVPYKPTQSRWTARKAFFGFVVFVLVGAFPAVNTKGASFLSGFTDWNSLQPFGKQAFVTGVLDFMVELAGPEEPFRRALASSASVCLAERQITNAQVVRDVDRLYGDYVGLRKASPAVVTYTAVIQECGDMVNKAMRQAGQPPIDFRNLVQNLSK